MHLFYFTLTFVSKHFKPSIIFQLNQSIISDLKKYLNFSKHMQAYQFNAVSSLLDDPDSIINVSGCLPINCDQLVIFSDTKTGSLA